MTTKTKKLGYNGCKNVLNRVAYKLNRNGKAYKHTTKITINNKTLTYNDIIKIIKQNGTNYQSNEYISRLMENIIINNKNLDFLPAFVIGGGGFNKYTRDYYVKIAKQLNSYRKKNNKNPAELTVSYDRFGYLTKEGCSGMGQCTGYYCACNALQQCFYRLTGILVPESTIAGWAGTTSDGTGHPGIETAVKMFNRKYDATVQIKWFNFSELGNSNKARWAKVKALMAKGALFFHLLYRNQYGHYEVPKSVDDVLKILNSLGDRCNYPAYCGYIETRTRGEQESYIAGISQKSVAFLYNG